MPREIKQDDVRAVRFPCELGHAAIELVEVDVFHHFDDKADVGQTGCDAVRVDRRVFPRRAFIGVVG
jgi:hypothetical protein